MECRRRICPRKNEKSQEKQVPYYEVIAPRLTASDYVHSIVEMFAQQDLSVINKEALELQKVRQQSREGDKDAGKLILSCVHHLQEKTI